MKVLTNKIEEVLRNIPLKRILTLDFSIEIPLISLLQIQGRTFKIADSQNISYLNNSEL